MLIGLACPLVVFKEQSIRMVLLKKLPLAPNART